MNELIRAQLEGETAEQTESSSSCCACVRVVGKEVLIRSPQQGNCREETVDNTEALGVCERKQIILVGRERNTPAVIFKPLKDSHYYKSPSL